MSAKPPDAELKIVSQIIAALGPLRHVQKCRVLDYVTSRVETEEAVAASPRLATVDDEIQEPPPVVEGAPAAPLFARSLVKTK